MKYVVVDLEMCEIPRSLRNKDFRWCRETIQIGAVLLDESYDVVARFNTFVCPQRGLLDARISRMTGIKNADLVRAPQFADALELFLNWLPEDDFRCVSWSNSDPKQIEHDMEARHMHIGRIEKIIEEWIDCQETFGDKMNSKRDFSLEEALVASDIYQEGQAHDGLMDAYNTAMLFTKLSLDPEYALNDIYMSAKEEVEHLEFSMGDLFKGFALQ